MLLRELYRVIGENDNGGATLDFPTLETAMQFIEATKGQFVGDPILQRITIELTILNYLEEENA